MAGIWEITTNGATLNSKYTKIDIKIDKVIQTAVYDSKGDVIGYVYFKNHGKGAASEPGNPASGHGK